MAENEDLNTLADRLFNVIDGISSYNDSTKPSKTDPKRYNTTSSYQLMRRTQPTVAAAEKDGTLPPPDLNEKGRRLGYTLSQINHARRVFGTNYVRKNTDLDSIPVVGVMNLKGGCGKTTTAVHLAQSLAEKGFRTLLLDVDPQGSATAHFGYNPDKDIAPENTLVPFLVGEDDDGTIEYAIRKTYWDGLDLVPSSLALLEAEYAIASADSKTAHLISLKHALQQDRIKEKYDIVVLDSAPSGALTNLACMLAANALIIPTPASYYDLYSAKSFLTLLKTTVEQLQDNGLFCEYELVRLLVTKLDTHPNGTQKQLENILQDMLGNYIIKNSTEKRAAVDRAGILGFSVFEADTTMVGKESLASAYNSFTATNNEIIDEITKIWEFVEEGDL